MAKTKLQARQSRRYRVRAKIAGTESKPRLSVYKSNKAIYAQIINDDKGVTLASSNNLVLKLNGANLENAAKVGTDVAAKAIAAGITEVVFDRGGNLYHGKIKAVAEAAREAGLKF